MMSLSISLQMSCNTMCMDNGQCPLLDGEVTEDIPEAIIVVENDQQEGSRFLWKGSPEAKMTPCWIRSFNKWCSSMRYFLYILEKHML